MMKKIALVLVGLFAIVLLFFVVEHFRGKWGLARWKARMVAKGEPVTIAAVTAPLPPADQNGMPPLLVALSQAYAFPSRILPPVDFDVSGKRIVATRLSTWPADSRPPSNYTWDVLGEALAPRRPTLKSAVEALGLREFNANLDYYGGWQGYLDHLGRLRYLEWTLEGAVLHDLHSGNLDQGSAFTVAAIRVPAVVKDESFTISHLIRFKMARQAFDLTWQVAHAGGLSDAHLMQIQNAWAEQDFLKPLRRALTMEHVMASYEYNKMRNSDISVYDWLGLSSGPPPIIINSPFDVVVTAVERAPGFFRNQIRSPIWKFAWSRQDELQFVKTVGRGIGAWDAAIADRSARPLQPLGDNEYRFLMDMSDISGSSRSSFRYMLSPRAARFFPIMKMAFVTQTLRSLAIAGLALRRYELRAGEPAPSLESLLPEFLSEVPTDFMDGQPLKYKPSTNGLTLYSVGANYKDDNASRTNDLVWPIPSSSDEITATLSR